MLANRISGRKELSSCLELHGRTAKSTGRCRKTLLQISGSMALHELQVYDYEPTG